MVSGDSEQPPISPSIAEAHGVNLQQLRTFLTIAEEGGRISRAASRLGLSQSSVSYQLAELETRLHARLLDRGRGRIAQLTRAGRVVVTAGQRLVAAEQTLIAELDTVRSNISGELRLSASPGPGEQWLPRVLARYRTAHPDVTISMHLADARTVVNAVADRDIELGLVGGRWHRAGLDFEAVHEDQLAFIAPVGHPLTERSSATLDEVIREPFVAQEPGSGQRVSLERDLEAAGVPLSDMTTVAEVGNHESVIAAVSAGMGIGCVWDSVAAPHVELGHVARVTVDRFTVAGSYYVVTRATANLTPEGRLLVQELRRRS